MAKYLVNVTFLVEIPEQYQESQSEDHLAYALREHGSLSFHGEEHDHKSNSYLYGCYVDLSESEILVRNLDTMLEYQLNKVYP